jgi:hypothetical protein
MAPSEASAKKRGCVGKAGARTEVSLDVFAEANEVAPHQTEEPRAWRRRR